MDIGTTFQFHFFNEIIIQLLKSDLPFDYFHPVQLLPPVHNLEGNSPHCRSISLSEGIYYFSFKIGVQKAPKVWEVWFWQDSSHATPDTSSLWSCLSHAMAPRGPSHSHTPCRVKVISYNVKKFDLRKGKGEWQIHLTEVKGGWESRRK